MKGWRQLTTSDGLEAAVAEELRMDPRVDAARITVSAEGGAINLKGIVRTYSERCCAERIAREIRGVTAVNNALEVRLSIGNYRTDAGLERLLSEILQNHVALCDPLPRVEVRDGWLTLDGVVSSDAQKRSAEEALRDVAGIRGITNNIEVAARPNGVDIKEMFEAAVLRRAALAVERLKVEVSGNTMKLFGSVGSCVEHDTLIELATRRRGIARVEDHVIVRGSSLAAPPR